MFFDKLHTLLNRVDSKKTLKESNKENIKKKEKKEKNIKDK